VGARNDHVTGKNQGVSTTSPSTTATCKGRESYPTYAEADQQAWFAMARRRNLSGDFMLAAHYCPLCASWHIGNPRKQNAERWSSALA
jgi:hypothetical protein